MVTSTLREDTMQSPRCVVCKVRAGYHLGNKLCKNCRKLVEAENTWKQYGIKRPYRKMSDKVFLKKYNELAVTGMTIPDIAEAMGMATQSLKNRKQLLAKEGHHVERAQSTGTPKLLPQKPIDRSTLTARNTNDHGGGKYGIDRCNCELCLAIRRKTRNEYNKMYRSKNRKPS
jgi:hypothetical protein